MQNVWLFIDDRNEKACMGEIDKGTFILQQVECNALRRLTQIKKINFESNANVMFVGESFLLSL